MKNKTPEKMAQYGKKLRELFSGPLGEEVLEMMVDMHVMVANEDMDPILEGERSFVLELKALVEEEIDLNEEEADEDE